jgi:hypothetical protein
MAVDLIRAALALMLLTSAGIAAEPTPVDPARDTLSPVYPVDAVPYSWSEIRAGKFELMPAHWQRSAANPLIPDGMNSRPVLQSDGTVRVYFGKRGVGGGICYFDVDPAEPAKPKGKVVGPIITTGQAGSFDDDWVLCPEPVWVTDTHLRMYYAAKKKGGFFAKVWSLGVADSADGGRTWTKYAGNPIMTATDDEWESGAVGFTSIERDGDGWRMWYLGTDTNGNAKKQIGYATSPDGYAWKRYEKNPVIAVNPHFEWERGAIAVARMIRDGRMIRTWYACYPDNNTYAVGCAESVDGLTWFRHAQNPVLKGNGTGFDSSMTAYPGTLRVGDRYLMYYSGNGYGSRGIGLATASVPRGTWYYRSGVSEKIDDAWTPWIRLGDEPAPRPKYIQFAVVSDGESGK